MRSMIRPLPSLSLVLAVLVMGLLAGSPAPASGQVPPVPKLERLPEFSVVTLDGKKFAASDLRGKVVLLDFWATWCVPCLQATPHLKSLAASLAKDNFMILGISVDDDGQRLQSYVAKEKIGWPQYWDRSKMLTYRTFQISTFPTYLVVDPEGKVVYQSRGWSDKVLKDLETNVRKAVQNAKQKKGGAKKAR
ncbi:MAG TPA: TlpA disulfide reductase family protein [Thermoanaerobaculia bacterium]|nr:TlpA disulfide reductase family protein [Thermoanaerobaculia bacterium]